MQTATDLRPLFENAEWTVTTEGLEHRWNGYFIECEQLADRRSDGLWAWPVHLSEKTWCDLPLFAEAFVAALGVSGVAPDAELAPSFLADWNLHAWGREEPAACAEDRGSERPFVVLGDLAQSTVAACRAAAPVVIAAAMRARSQHLRSGGETLRTSRAAPGSRRVAAG